MLSKIFIQKYKTSFAILLFVLLFFIFHTIKPSFAYGRDGEFREFGVGYKNKTVLPVWIVVIALAILSYLATLMILRLDIHP